MFLLIHVTSVMLVDIDAHSLSPANKPQHNRPVFLGTVPSYTTQQTCVPGYCTFIHNTTDLCSWVLYLHTQHNRPVFLGTVPSYTTQQTCVPGTVPSYTTQQTCVPGYCTFIHNTTDLCSWYCTFIHNTTDLCSWVLYLHTQHNRPVFLGTVPSYTTQQTCVPGYCTFIHNTTDLCSWVLYLHTCCVCPNCMNVDSCCRHFSASEFMGRGGGRNCGFTNV